MKLLLSLISGLTFSSPIVGATASAVLSSDDSRVTWGDPQVPSLPESLMNVTANDYWKNVESMEHTSNTSNISASEKSEINKLDLSNVMDVKQDISNDSQNSNILDNKYVFTKNEIISNNKVNSFNYLDIDGKTTPSDSSKAYNKISFDTYNNNQFTVGGKVFLTTDILSNSVSNESHANEKQLAWLSSVEDGGVKKKYLQALPIYTSSAKDSNDSRKNGTNLFTPFSFARKENNSYTYDNFITTITGLNDTLTFYNIDNLSEKDVATNLSEYWSLGKNQNNFSLENIEKILGVNENYSSIISAFSIGAYEGDSPLSNIIFLGLYDLKNQGNITYFGFHVNMVGNEIKLEPIYKNNDKNKGPVSKIISSGISSSTKTYNIYTTINNGRDILAKSGKDNTSQYFLLSSFIDEENGIDTSFNGEKRGYKWVSGSELMEEAAKADPDLGNSKYVNNMKMWIYSTPIDGNIIFRVSLTSRDDKIADTRYYTVNVNLDKYKNMSFKNVKWLFSLDSNENALVQSNNISSTVSSLLTGSVFYKKSDKLKYNFLAAVSKDYKIYIYKYFYDKNSGYSNFGEKPIVYGSDNDVKNQPVLQILAQYPGSSDSNAYSLFANNVFYIDNTFEVYSKYWNKNSIVSDASYFNYELDFKNDDLSSPKKRNNLILWVSICSSILVSSVIIGSVIFFVIKRKNRSK